MGCRRSNNLTFLNSNAFPSLPNAVSLYLQGNSIAEIEAGAFREITTLETIGLEQKKLTAIRGDMWEGVTRLTNLYLEHNQIEHLSRASLSISSQTGSFSSSLTNCETLILNNNLISEIEDGTFTDLIHLKNLRLTDDILTDVRAGMSQGLGNLELLAIDDN